MAKSWMSTSSETKTQVRYLRPLPLCTHAARQSPALACANAMARTAPLLASVPGGKRSLQPQHKQRQFASELTASFLVAGKSRGFAFLAYEDQRSTVLAVDNLSGGRVAGRIITVNHVDNYKVKRAEVHPEAHARAIFCL